MEEFELHEEILELLVDQLELVLKSSSRLVLPILPVNVQVWSLTKFYSVDFLLSRIAVKSVLFTNTKSRFELAVFDSVLAPHA